jgi:hypothetical protein
MRLDHKDRYSEEEAELAFESAKRQQWISRTFKRHSF